MTIETFVLIFGSERSLTTVKAGIRSFHCYLLALHHEGRASRSEWCSRSSSQPARITRRDLQDSRKFAPRNLDIADPAAQPVLSSDDAVLTDTPRRWRPGEPSPFNCPRSRIALSAGPIFPLSFSQWKCSYRVVRSSRCAAVFSTAFAVSLLA